MSNPERLVDNVTAAMHELVALRAANAQRFAECRLLRCIARAPAIESRRIGALRYQSATRLGERLGRSKHPSRETHAGHAQGLAESVS